MAHEYELTFTVPDTDEIVSLIGQFTKEEWEQLEEFLQYASDLLNTKFVREGHPASFSSYIASGIDVSAILPPWDDVTVFLHKFRPIGLQKERTCFYKICNVLSKELKHPYIRSEIEMRRDFYSGKLKHYQIRVNDSIINSEKVLYDWLNSYEYHRDKGKRAFIDSLHQIFPLDGSKAIFVLFLIEKTNAIYDIAALIRGILVK